MRVDELTIPHPDGAVQVRFHERLTVLAGLPPSARARFAGLLVGALTGAGPARAQVHDGLGRVVACGAEDGPAPLDAARRDRMVVGARALGLDAATTDPMAQAERTAVAMAHRELVRELAALEAGASERARLEAEAAASGGPAPAGDPQPSSPVAPSATAPAPGPAASSASSDTAAPRPDGGPSRRPGGEPDGGPDLDAVARAAPTIDELLRRRQVADDVLRHTGAILRTFADGPERPVPPAAGEPPPTGHPLGEGLRAAVDALRRVEAGSTLVATLDRAQAQRDARAAVRRALDELERAQGRARTEVATCDEALAAVAAAAGVAIGAGGPGAALTAAMTARRTRPAAADADDPAARLLARRRAVLRSRIDELPEEDEVVVARRRLAAVTAKLAALDAAGHPDVAGARAALLGRAAAQRGSGGSVAPLVLDDPFAALPVEERCDLLELAARVAERTQVVLLTGDPVVATWARNRHTADLRLIDLAR